MASGDTITATQSLQLSATPGAVASGAQVGSGDELTATDDAKLWPDDQGNDWVPVSTSSGQRGWIPSSAAQPYQGATEVFKATADYMPIVVAGLLVGFLLLGKKG